MKKALFSILVISITGMCLLGFYLPRASSTQSDQLNLTGEEIFTAIFFGEGSLVSKIPELSNFNPKNLISDQKMLNEYKETRIKLINAIRNKYPKFFDDFKKQMLVGDPVKIRGSLKEASGKLSIVSNEMFMKELERTKQDPNYQKLYEQITNDKDVKLAVSNGGDLKAALKKYMTPNNPNNLRGAALPVAALAIWVVVVYQIAAAVEVAAWANVWFWAARLEPNVHDAKRTLLEEKIIAGLVKLKTAKVPVDKKN